MSGITQWRELAARLCFDEGVGPSRAPERSKWEERGFRQGRARARGHAHGDDGELARLHQHQVAAVGVTVLLGLVLADGDVLPLDGLGKGDVPVHQHALLRLQVRGQAEVRQARYHFAVDLDGGVEREQLLVQLLLQLPMQLLLAGDRLRAQRALHAANVLVVLRRQVLGLVQHPPLLQLLLRKLGHVAQELLIASLHYSHPTASTNARRRHLPRGDKWGSRQSGTPCRIVSRQSQRQRPLHRALQAMRRTQHAAADATPGTKSSRQSHAAARRYRASKNSWPPG